MAAARKTFLDGLLYFFNVIFALLLLGSYLAYYVPSSVTTVFSIIALGYPVWFFVNLAFAIYWLIRFKTKVFLPIVVISLGYMHVGRLYQFGGAEKVVANDQKLKVMSFNVRLFNQYDWIDDHTIETQIVELIKDENPDVLMLQEYKKTDKATAKSLGFSYSSFKPNRNGQYGLAIFSKFKIEKSEAIIIENDSSYNNQFQYADIVWKKKPIRFINVHLASIGLEYSDYELLENPDTENHEKLEKGIKSIANNLSNAFKRREVQIQSVVHEIQTSPNPVVLAGDFNDVPQSFVYHEIDNELEDSFTESGQGFGKTYVKSPVPLRIDYIFHSENLHALNFKHIKRELSDHYPITADLEWRL
ncbi:endonuclease/exonuclease/phosphatase family protein [Owenweeksia hongkongensis]|uniref:endonuclease/exonuclease/phosphatase family protein n=1 Tax=Owenweeksia hongkongensis TaxID=253245 RepID=UPI003A8D4801